MISVLSVTLKRKEPTIQTKLLSDALMSSTIMCFTCSLGQKLIIFYNNHAHYTSTSFIQLCIVYICVFAFHS